MSRGHAVGRAGETAAAEWYVAHGYEVLARNWRSPDGELDLVVGDGRTVVFCEVKARSSGVFGLPIEAVTPAKQARLRRLAARWLASGAVPPARRRVVRFDVASVTRGAVEIIEGVM